MWGGFMDVEVALKRLKRNLRVVKHGGSSAEVAFTEASWRGLVDLFSREGDGLSAVELFLVEEALVWRVLAYRFERVLGKEGLFLKEKEGGRSLKGVVHPGVEALAKARERLRKVMKAILDRLRCEKGSDGAGWAQ